MGKITEALKKVTDDRLTRIQKKPEFEYVVKRLENTVLDQRLVSFHDSTSPIGEQYKILRTNIQTLRRKQGYKSFVITSSIGGEGKTVTALNLAIAMAQDSGSKSVLLIDADMRKGRVAKYMGIKSQRGLSELLQEKVSAESVFTGAGIENLTFVLSGKSPKHPSELLNSKKMERFLAACRTKFDYILIDAPPVLPVTDACILAPMADGVIMVVQAGRTQVDAIKHAETRLYQARAKLIGCVLTNVEYHVPSYLHRYINKYDSYYRYHEKEKEFEREGVMS